MLAHSARPARLIYYKISVQCVCVYVGGGGGGWEGKAGVCV